MHKANLCKVVDELVEIVGENPYCTSRDFAGRRTRFYEKKCGQLWHPPAMIDMLLEKGLTVTCDAYKDKLTHAAH